ncbi:hypothetical protein [Sphingomonas sp. UYP23]
METNPVAASPRRELMDYDAIHPVCVVRGPGVRENVAQQFCAAVTAVLKRSGYTNVVPAHVGEARLAEPRHIVLGFTLAAQDQRLTIAALLSRIDRPSGALLPPPAEALFLPVQDAALAASAERLLKGLGL